MEKLSEKLRELSAAQEPCEPFTRDYGRKTAFAESAQLAEAYEAEWEKRVAELQEAVTWRTSMMDQWQAQSESQKKEIVELEAEVSRLAWWEERSAELIPKEEYHELQETIMDLESQLAWTPVSDGLPTEPGWYVFNSDDAAPELLNLNPKHWSDTKGWNDNFIGVNPDAPEWGYTRFRFVMGGET